jgi:hypothetical protein
LELETKPTSVFGPRKAHAGEHKGVEGGLESPSLVLVINDTKLLMSCVKWFKLGISNTCDEGACDMELWPQDHIEIVHGHEMMVMVIKHEEMDMEQSDQSKGIIIWFAFAGIR